MAETGNLKPGELDPELVEAVKNGPQLPTSTDISFWKKIDNVRRNTVWEALGPVPPGITEVDHEVKMRDGASIIIRSYQPDKMLEGGSPLIVLYHGGGFALGGLESETMTCRSISMSLGAVVCNVDYRLAPDYKFPTAAHDAWDALKWISCHKEVLKATPSKGFIVGGTSAGGNLASVVTHMARDEELSPPLTGQYLSVPLLFSPVHASEQCGGQHSSHDENKNSPILSPGLLGAMIASYEPDVKSPLFATFNDPSGHARLPPTYFQVCGADILRDDGIIYEKSLREKYNINTRIDSYPGQPHMFWAIYPGMRQSIKWREDMLEGIRWLIQQV